MEKKTEQVLKSLKGKRVGAFWDDSNIFHAYRNYGWKISVKKFKNLLEKYCDLKFFNYYIAIPRKNDSAYRGTMRLLEAIKPLVSIKKKNLKYIQKGEGVIEKKGDVDVEIALDVVRTLDELEVVIVVSGDSDLLELKNYVVEDKGKEIIFVGYKKNMAWELRLCKHIFVNRIKEEVSLQE